MTPLMMHLLLYNLYKSLLELITSYQLLVKPVFHLLGGLNSTRDFKVSLVSYSLQKSCVL
jgi:hypothetical protein